jgi:hypothetical protein
MYLHAIIFMKLENVFTQLNSNSNQYYLTFTPVSTAFTNTEFNFLDSSISAGALSDSIENEMAFAYFANAIIRNPKVYTLTIDDFLQNSYKKIFENALLIDSSITDADKQTYKDARNILFINENLDATPEYDKYLTYCTKYKEISTQLTTIADTLMANPSDADSLAKQQTLQAKQNIIFNDWLIEGNKEKIEKALKIVQNLNARSVFVNQWNNEYSMLKTNLQNLTTINSNFEFLPVSCLPNNLYDYAYHGWKKIVLEENEINALTDEVKKFLGDSLYNAADDGNPNASKVEFEYIFVSILRNWFKPGLINSKYWSFAKDSTDVVSAEDDLTKGILPSYIDKFIFIRRVCAYNKITSDNQEAVIPETTFKVLRFKDIAGIKKVQEIKTVAPVEASTAKFRIFSAESPVIKPVLMKKSMTSKIMMRDIDKTSMFLAVQPAVIAPATTDTASADHIAVRAVRTTGFLHADFAERHMILTPPPAVTDPPRTNFNLTLGFKDNLNNPLEGINTLVTNKQDGSNYSAETHDDGSIFLPNLPKAEYNISVQNEELYEDIEISIDLTTDVVKPIVLEKRANPRFDMFLIGAINYRFPKLPDPLPDFIYS